MEARWTQSVWLRVACRRGEIHPFLLACDGAPAPQRRAEASPLGQNNHLRQEDRCSLFYFFIFLPLSASSTLAGFSRHPSPTPTHQHTPSSLPGFVSGCCSLMHSQNWSTVSLLDEFNGFSAARRKSREVFLQFASCRWKLVPRGSVFLKPPLAVNVGFRCRPGAL